MDRAMALGHVNMANTASGGPAYEMMDLTSSAKALQEKHAAMLRAQEIKQRMQTVIVPSRDEDVMMCLRIVGLPICLFGERAMDRRTRLRAYAAEHPDVDVNAFVPGGSIVSTDTMKEDTAPLVAVHTLASDALVAARARIAENSWAFAKTRLTKEFEHASQTNAIPLSSYTQVVTQVGTRPVSGCKLDRTNQYLAIANWSGNVELYCMRDFSIASTLRGVHVDRVVDVDISPISATAETIVSGGADGMVVCWKRTQHSNGDGDTHFEFQPTVLGANTDEQHLRRISRVRFSPCGKFVVSTSFDHTFRLWDIETSQSLLVQDGHAREVYGVAYHPDTALVVTGDLGGAGRVWDLRNGRTVFTLQAHLLGILDIDCHENGWQIATGSLDNTVRLWDLRGKLAGAVLPAHVKPVTKVKFWGSQYLISASHDRTVKVTNLGNATKSCSFTAHDGPIFGCDVRKDNGDVITGGYDRCWRLFSPSSL